MTTVPTKRDRGGVIRKNTLRNGKAFRVLRSAAFVKRIGGTGIMVAESWDRTVFHVYWDVRQGPYDAFVTAPTRRHLDKLIRGKQRAELDHWPSRLELVMLGLRALMSLRETPVPSRVVMLGTLDL